MAKECVGWILLLDLASFRTYSLSDPICPGVSFCFQILLLLPKVKVGKQNVEAGPQISNNAFSVNGISIFFGLVKIKELWIMNVELFIGSSFISSFNNAAIPKFTFVLYSLECIYGINLMFSQN